MTELNVEELQKQWEDWQETRNLDAFKSVSEKLGFWTDEAEEAVVFRKQQLALDKQDRDHERLGPTRIVLDDIKWAVQARLNELLKG